MREGRVRGIEDDDGLAVVAALLEELLGLLEVLLGRARRRLEGAAADEDAGAGLAVLGIADDGLEIVLLARHVEERLPRLLAVEERGERVGADGAQVSLR